VPSSKFSVFISLESSVALKNFANTNYIGEIQIGNPPQKIRALFDTGSANSWVLSTDCRNAKTIRENHMFFNPDSSSSYEDTGEAAKIFFGSGSLEGSFGRDDFYIVNSKGDKIVVDSQTFGLVRKQTTFDETFDAIIGLAYPAMAENAGFPLMDEMIKQKKLLKNVFSFYLTHNEKEESELLFGAVDHSKYEGHLHCH